MGKFSDKIVRRDFGSGATIYQVAFANVGRRKMIDLEIVVRIGIDRYMGATGWAYHTIKTNASKVPELGAGERSRRLVRIFDTREPMQFVDLPSKKIRTALLACRTLEDVLKLSTDGTVQVHVFGYDKFSGTRRLLSSEDYRISDIVVGRLEGLKVVKDDRASEYD
jgi:hypothetical protein